MPSRAVSSTDHEALGIRTLGVGALVRVESKSGDVWSANVTYVNDRLVGMRGWTPVDRIFRERDTVVLLIGHGSRLISATAQVLAATGSLLRVVRRDGSDEIDRRRAPRLRVDVVARVEVHDADVHVFDADVVDLSTSGCAIRSDTWLPVGTEVTVTMDLNDARTELSGEVVRTWNGDAPAPANAGIKFDAPATGTAATLNRFLVNQFQADLPVSPAVTGPPR